MTVLSISWKNQVEYTVAQPNLPIIFITINGWPENFFTPCNTVMERKFCGNSEYVCRNQIRPQSKATKTFNWHSSEIAQADLNSTCNLRLIEANIGVQSLIWTHSQSNIKLKLHFWPEATSWPRGHRHGPVYDLKTTG